MTVKSERGRQRYIAFDVSPKMEKDALIKRFRSAGPDRIPYIIQCSSGKAIIRCSPKEKEESIRMMSLIDPSSVPLTTSGTLRKIRERYPELKAAKK